MEQLLIALIVKYYYFKFRSFLPLKSIFFKFDIIQFCKAQFITIVGLNILINTKKNALNFSGTEPCVIL